MGDKEKQVVSVGKMKGERKNNGRKKIGGDGGWAVFIARGS